MKNRTTNPNILKLSTNEIFVFGSNAEGNHAGGAAKLAAEIFGAEHGVSEGLTGQCYAINTMSGLDLIIEQIDPFLLNAHMRPEKIFLVTEIGCGIAGFKPEQIAPLFEDAKNLDNVHLPESFWAVLNTPKIRGYKVFNSDMKCRGFQFEVGKDYVHKGKLEICASGFHFCINANHCFDYYSFDPKNVVCEVEAIGDVQTHPEDSKVATNHIRIVRQLTWQEVLVVANTGKNNTGRGNSGDSNSGDRNSGDRNSGYRNSGDRNSGDSNSGYRNSGAFCTATDPVMTLFDKPCVSMTVKQWEQHPACQLMQEIDPTVWIPWSHMTEQEKKDNPKYELLEGYTKKVDIKDAWKNAWGNWTDDRKAIFTSLENFDTVKFEQITGIKVV